MTEDPRATAALLGATSVDVKLVRGGTQVRLVFHRNPPRFTHDTTCGDAACGHAPCGELTCQTPHCDDDTCLHGQVLFNGPLLLTNAFDVDLAGAARLRELLDRVLLTANHTGISHHAGALSQAAFET